jgi:hypothetical protein
VLEAQVDPPAAAELVQLPVELGDELLHQLQRAASWRTSNRKLRGLIEAIAEGPNAPALQAKLDELEQRKTAPEAELAACPCRKLHN